MKSNQNKQQLIARAAIMLGVAIVGVLIVMVVGFNSFWSHADPGETLVRSNQYISKGVQDNDLSAGYHLNLPAQNVMHRVDAKYHFINFSATNDYGQEYDPIRVRIGEDNIIFADLTIPIRVIPGKTSALVARGQTFDTALRDGLNTIQGTLRDELATMDTTEWYAVYNPAIRAITCDEVCNDEGVCTGGDVPIAELGEDGYPQMLREAVVICALQELNEALAEYHLEAESIDIRSFRLPDQYESNLTNVQLQQQQARLNDAQAELANQQQELDNYTNETDALVARREAEWAAWTAALNDGLRNGVSDANQEVFFETMADVAMVNRANEFGGVEHDSEQFTNARQGAYDTAMALYGDERYALGIEGIRALTAVEVAELEGQSSHIVPRYAAEAEAIIAEILQSRDERKNALLDSTGGRAYVASEMAGNLTFAPEITFASDTMPWPLFPETTARALMGE